MSKKDLRRLVDGVSLILLESSKRVPKPQTLISQSLKSILNLAGLTKGTPRPLHPDSSISSSSIVHFDHDAKGSTFASGEVKSPILDAETSTFAASGEEKTPLPASDGADLGEKDSNLDPKSSSFAASGEETTPLPASDGAGLGEKDSNLDPKSSSFAASEDKTPVPSSDLHSDGGAAIVENSEHQKPLELVVKRQRRRPRERRVPSTPIGRALGFAGLGAGLAWGTIQESAKRIAFGSENAPASPFLSEQNAERLAVALCRMRGAALKLGQMLSIQDESVVPAPILSALDIVRQGADVMPRSQLNEVLDSELGPDWSKKLKSFDYEPLAAASIGQVHRAVTRDGLEVAMKIQYPGVANSIDSDIENAKRLLTYTNLIPKGLFLDRAIKVAKEELARECDYELEAASQKRFRQLLSNMDGVYVPMVVGDISSKRVLTTELVSGIPIDKVVALNQETRNYVGRKLLEVTLKELFVFRFMQTDPNWSNFLYDENTNTINLIDFGAARGYRKEFVDDYLRMVLACANRDRDVVIEMSTRLGFLTGEESEVMLDAHVQASFIVGLPFSTSEYDFRASNITSSVSHLGATMLKHRLTPPPDEAYSLHRKLSGAFLACIKLGGIIPCRDLLLQIYQQYDFSDNNEDTLSSATS